jgi:hypothetical protein
MKQCENSMETRDIYLEMSDMCSISYSSKFIQYSNSSHVCRNCDPLTLAMACEIRS